jgi:hypothetical protein
MYLTDYTITEDGDDCDITKIRFAKRDLIGAVVKKVEKDEIVVELVSKKLVHIMADAFEFTTLEGGSG